MDKSVEQRACIKFCFKNDISCSDTLKMLRKCYVDECLSRSQVFKWYKSFSNGRETVEDEHRSGRPSTSITDENINKIKELVLSNRRLTQRNIADIVGISKGSIQSILKEDLSMCRVSSREWEEKVNIIKEAYNVNDYNDNSSTDTGSGQKRKLTDVKLTKKAMRVQSEEEKNVINAIDFKKQN